MIQGICRDCVSWEEPQAGWKKGKCLKIVYIVEKVSDVEPEIASCGCWGGGDLRTPLSFGCSLFAPRGE